jgi:hypothetical protein
MGKTAIALASLCVLQHHGEVQSMLVIAPLRPMYLTWPARWPVGAVQAPQGVDRPRHA